jgi:hypothetical protein
MTQDIRRRRLEGLGFSLFLSCLFLGCCIWIVYRELGLILGASKVTGSISWVTDFNVVLASRLAVFALTVLLMHAAFGLLVWALARLTRAAFPTTAARWLPGLIVAWTLTLAIAAFAANAVWYPNSRFAFIDFGLPAAFLTISTASLIVGALGAIAVALAVLACLRSGIRRIPAKGPAPALAAAAALVIVVASLSGHRSLATTASAAPNIIILGVDSLRNDLREVSRGRSPTPRVDAFLSKSHRFSDAITPLARTYPSWVSILTGRHPVSTNARFNLMPRSLVHESDTLADALKAKGYRAIYATDEVRFANFDATYGFDTTITPPVGASDFVIGAIGDQPLVNLIAGSPLGAVLFPQIYANRADATTYAPGQFIDRLDRNLRNDGPSFLAIHLTLSHWPYSRAGEVEPTTPQSWRPAYREALTEVDRQFDEVLALLERKGFLRNAYVAVLSDHGEALGFPSDSLVRKTGSPTEIWDSLWGHGTSVVSPHQYGVVLGFRAFGAATLPGQAGREDWPVSLEDVRPTLEELATGRAPRGVDGISLVPFMRDPASAAGLDRRIRFTETCFNTVKLLKGKITASGVVSEAGIYYEMAPESGWVQLRPERLPEILGKKQRAAMSTHAILAAIPSWTDDTVTYLYVDRREGSPRRLTGPPAGQSDPEAARLWAALEGRFPGEMARRRDPPPM